MMHSLDCSSCSAPARDLGCFPACGPIELPLYAPMDGTYTFQYYKSGVLINKDVVITGAPIRMTVTDLFPEHATTYFKIIDPNGFIFKYSLLRDKLGVKGLQNFESIDCCEECSTLFKIRTILNFQIIDEVPTVLVDPCITP